MGGLEAMDPRYQALYERARAVLGADPRVDEVRLAGSAAEGTADRWSDLDLQVITVPDGYEEFLGEWRAWLAAVTPTVFARTPLAPFIINSVTADGLTLDIAVYAGNGPPGGRPTTEYSVGMLSRTRFDSLGAALEYAVGEQLRGLAGPYITLLRRGEYMRHMTGVPHVLGLLTTVFLAETGSPPPGKRWNLSFTEEQRATVAALPPLRATEEGVRDFDLALAELVVTRGRPLFPRYGLEWPAGLAAVAADRLQEHLGIDARSWLY